MAKKFFARSLSYTLGRISSVAIRPLCLFIANNWFSSDAAIGLAITFLVSALSMAATSADPHRRYYTILFSKFKTTIGLSFYLYISSIILLVFMGVLFAFGFGVYFTGSIVFSVVIAIYFISEKLADEVLRLRLFERDLSRWGHSSLLKSLIQFSCLLGLFILFGKNVYPIAIVMILALSNFLVFIPQLPMMLFQSVKRLRGKLSCWLILRALRSLISNRMLWFIALMSSVVGYLDRLAFLKLDKSVLPLFTLVVMCFSVVQMLVDFYYLSPRRRDFLEHRIHLTSAISSGHFLFPLVGGLMTGAVATTLVLFFSNNSNYFSFSYVLAIAFLQILLAISLLPIQILYWSNSVTWIFYIELFIFTSICIILFVGYLYKFSIMEYLFVISLAIMLRLFAFIYVAQQEEYVQ
uniref:hypothetical protein n=1 Tax=Polynucleobacter sp. TaxID=2029855 RepID=UPI0040475BB8